MTDKKENLFKRLRSAMGVSAINDMTPKEIDEVFQSLHDKNVKLTEEIKALKAEREHFLFENQKQVLFKVGAEIQKHSRIGENSKYFASIIILNNLSELEDQLSKGESV